MWLGLARVHFFCGGLSIKMSILGFIGGGNMSSAVWEGVRKAGLYLPSDVWVSGPHIENLSKWKHHGVHVTTKNSDIVKNCDIIFLGIKPHLLSEAVRGCTEGLTLGDKTKCIMFVSMLAGVAIHDLIKELEQITSNLKVVRTMPNTPMLIGAGACLYTPGPDIDVDECALIEKILGACGLVAQVKEELINTLGALTGCGPAYMCVVLEALSDGAVKQGVPRAIATKFAAQMMMGTARMVLETGKHPAQLKDEVCSPGGSTICGVTELENGKIRATMISAIEASTRRNGELGQRK